MVILHFACIDDSKTNGVCVAVPLHVQAQGKYAKTALININNIKVPGTINQIPFVKPFDIRKLSKPFDHPDLVVFHECYRPAFLLVAKHLRKYKTPYIIVPHGELRAEAQQKKHLKKVLANLLLFNRFINHAAALQCLSDNEIAATHFKPNKFVGTNGVEIPDCVKKEFREDGVVFIYIGRYEWRVKGLDLLFDAIKEKADFLREKHCRFFLYGPDVYGRFAAVSAMVGERKIADLVTLHHEILDNDKKVALLDADIFIQTSRHEGMPIGILEAMSYGLPCLVTEGTSLGEMIKSNNAGWVAKTTAEDIGERIIEAINDRARWGKLGSNGRDIVRKNYCWNIVAESTVKKYKKTL